MKEKVSTNEFSSFLQILSCWVVNCTKQQQALSYFRVFFLNKERFCMCEHCYGKLVLAPEGNTTRNSLKAVSCSGNSYIWFIHFIYLFEAKETGKF